MIRDAVFSPCRRFRYQLIRIWDPTKPLLPWGGCNPSDADATKDDQTARKVVGFTRLLFGGRYGGAVLWNPFALVSRDPLGLRAAGWPVGPENDRYILEACAMGDGPVIVGWGVNLRGLERPQRVLQLLREHGYTPMALGLTKDGIPKHPLYLSYSATPQPLH
jgi:hypothetical protein